ncbi:hypothetical protein K491DRAFT_696792 [Lophiostoma macrostomum CBS 122681]|uniref:Uncharacterized protein n=1 Tax=Lophiostoma macrostomum CBS 122681 TaxID=1314788 RepID=A0A6A6SXT4_9PLEO|nr:hypothetical protein K491DRAFT_696792 [Lophiostoma macrostomum CBS 122681]
MDPDDSDKALVLTDDDVLRTINDVLSPIHPDRKNMSLSEINKAEKARTKKREYAKSKRESDKDNKNVKAAGGKLSKSRVTDSDEEDEVE